MRLLSRAEWGATAPLYHRMNLPAVGVHIHHSVTLADDDHSLESTADVARDMREIEAVGISRFGRFSYSYAGHPSGVIGEGAGVTIGAHTEGYNSTTFGYVLIGNYENDAPTDAQVGAFGEWWRAMVAYGLLRADAYVKPHRDRKATACPGAHTIERWSDFLAARTTVPLTPLQQETDDMDLTDKLLVNGEPIGNSVNDTLAWTHQQADRLVAALLNADGSPKVLAPAIDYDVLAGRIAERVVVPIGVGVTPEALKAAVVAALTEHPLTPKA